MLMAQPHQPNSGKLRGLGFKVQMDNSQCEVEATQDPSQGKAIVYSSTAKSNITISGLGFSVFKANLTAERSI